MADLSDVENALLAILNGIAYPNGPNTASIIDTNIRLYRGWSIAMNLSADIAAGTTNVSIFPVPDTTRNTTRWGLESTSISVIPGITISAQANAVTLLGTATSTQLIGILVDNTSFVYTAASGDSAARAASALYDQIILQRPCQIKGATLTLPGAASCVGRSSAMANCVQESARQSQDFRISIWAPSPKQRDYLCAAFSAGLAPISFLTLADGTGGRIRYQATMTSDDDRDTSTYRRDLIYGVEYGTTSISTQPVMLFGDLQWNGRPIIS